MNRLIILLISLSLLAACAKGPQTFHESAEADFKAAKAMIDDGGYDEADLFLERYITKYPYSEHATNAELLRVYATYKGERLELTQVLAERFIQRHPRHPNLAYAQYMIAMSWYKQRAKMNREQAPTLKAKKEFEKLIHDFPDSSYAQEVKPRLQQLNNLLAGHELTIAKFYFEHERFVASVNRLQLLMHSFQNSPAIEEGLYYLSASYAALGMKKQAKEFALLLRHNYPKGEWSEQAQAYL